MSIKSITSIKSIASVAVFCLALTTQASEAEPQPWWQGTPSPAAAPRELLHGVAARRVGDDAGQRYRPIDELAPRTGYVVALEGAP